MLLDMLDKNRLGYSCGSDLDLTGYDKLTGPARPFVRLKLTCSSHMEPQLYSSNVLSTAEADAICYYCERRAWPTRAAGH
eukprot:4332429-Prymnesium_polylepis.1